MGRAKANSTDAVKLRGLPGFVDISRYTYYDKNLQKLDDHNRFFFGITEKKLDMESFHARSIAKLADMKGAPSILKQMAAISFLTREQRRPKSEVYFGREIFSWSDHFNQLWIRSGYDTLGTDDKERKTNLVELIPF